MGILIANFVLKFTNELIHRINTYKRIINLLNVCLIVFTVQNRQQNEKKSLYKILRNRAWSYAKLRYAQTDTGFVLPTPRKSYIACISLSRAVNHLTADFAIG